MKILIIIKDNLTIQSFLQQVVVHFYGIQVPRHLCFGVWSDLPELLEELIWHLLVRRIQWLLHFGFKILYYFYYILWIFLHICCKLEFLLQLPLLVELHVPAFKKVGFYVDNPLNLLFCNFPFWYPLSCVKVCKVRYVFGCQPKMYFQSFLWNLHKNLFKAFLPWTPKGVR